jgi:hypothetical protein
MISLKVIITDPTVIKPVITKHEGDISVDEWKSVQERVKYFRM